PKDMSAAEAPRPSREACLLRWGLRSRIWGPPVFRPSPGGPRAPPANLGLASGLVARCAHYRSVRAARQVARSSDFVLRMVDRLLAMNTLERGIPKPADLQFSEVCA